MFLNVFKWFAYAFCRSFPYFGIEALAYSQIHQGYCDRGLDSGVVTHVKPSPFSKRVQFIGGARSYRVIFSGGRDSGSWSWIRLPVHSLVIFLSRACARSLLHSRLAMGEWLEAALKNRCPTENHEKPLFTKSGLGKGFTRFLNCHNCGNAIPDRCGYSLQATPGQLYLKTTIFMISWISVSQTRPRNSHRPKWWNRNRYVKGGIQKIHKKGY